MFENKEEKKVEYIELIYDLIFVYLIGRNSSLVQHVENGFINWSLFLTYALCTLIIIQIWNASTFYINRYGRNGIRDHIFLFINMYLLYYMADATRADWHDSYLRYNIAWGLILINIAIQYIWKLKQNSKAIPWENSHLKWNITVLMVQAVIVFVSVPIYLLTGLPLSPVALVFGIVMNCTADHINSLVMVDFPHLAERAMLYVVFTFGEMVIALAGYFADNISLNTIYFSLFGFVIVAGLFVSYEIFYNYLLDRDRQTNGTAFMMLHVFMIFALNNITIALEFMAEEAVATLPKVIYITVSIIVFYIFLLSLGRFARKKSRPPRSFFVKVFSAGAAFLALMFIFYNNMYVNIAVTAAYVVFILMVLLLFRKKLENNAIN